MHHTLLGEPSTNLSPSHPLFLPGELPRTGPGQDKMIELGRGQWRLRLPYYYSFTNLLPDYY